MACRWSSALRHGRKADANPGERSTTINQQGLGWVRCRLPCRPKIGRLGSGSQSGQGCCFGVATHLQGRSRPGCNRPAARKIGMGCLQVARRVVQVQTGRERFVFLVGAGLRWCRKCRRTRISSSVEAGLGQVGCSGCRCAGLVQIVGWSKALSPGWGCRRQLPRLDAGVVG